MQGPLSLKNKMLSNPLISISKASTPIRMRIVSSNASANSTPISQLKFGSSSPFNELNNKQNRNTNNLQESNLLESKKSQQKNIQSFKNQITQFSKTISFGDQRFKKSPIQTNKLGMNLRESGAANLSPIMALNRKISQGPFRNEPFRSFTPQNIKREESPLNISHDKVSEQGNKSMIVQQKPHLATSNYGMGLRQSSSFSSLFQKRSKTPTRLGSMAFSSLSSKNPISINSSKANPLKQSMSFNNQLNNSKGRLQLGIHKKQSQSQYSNNSRYQSSNAQIQNSNNQQDKQMMCYNNHSKLAKYRIATTEDEQQAQTLVYCSKCAIDLVQKGFSVQEIYQDKGNQMTSLVTLPRDQHFGELRQSKSLQQSKFFNFKTTYNSQFLQKLQAGQRLKSIVQHEISQIQTKKQIINRKCQTDMQSIDCYYNSLIAYIEKQRSKDKTVLQDLKVNLIRQITHCQNNQNTQNNNQNNSYEMRLHNYYGKIQHFLKTRNANSVTGRQLNEIETELNQYQQQNQYSKQLHNLLSNQSSRIIYFDTCIQDQFDQFVSYLDRDGKLQYRTYQQSYQQQQQGYQEEAERYQNTQNKMIIGKSNPMRFSFEKVLQNQMQKKAFMQSQMNPLEEEEEQEYDQNSFNQENNMMESQQNLKGEQKPFRTLFADQDDILQQQPEERAKNSMYSPTFKAI